MICDYKLLILDNTFPLINHSMWKLKELENIKKPKEVTRSVWAEYNIQDKTRWRKELQSCGEKFKITGPSPLKKEKYIKASTNSKTNIYICNIYIYIYLSSNIHIYIWILFLLRFFIKIYTNICHKTAQNICLIFRGTFILTICKLHPVFKCTEEYKFKFTLRILGF